MCGLGEGGVRVVSIFFFLDNESIFLGEGIFL